MLEHRSSQYEDVLCNLSGTRVLLWSTRDDGMEVLPIVLCSVMQLISNHDLEDHVVVLVFPASQKLESTCCVLEAQVMRYHLSDIL